MSFVQLSGRSWDGTEVVERFIKIISNEIIMNEIVIKKVIKKLFISIDNMNINIYNYDINNLGKIREIYDAKLESKTLLL